MATKGEVGFSIIFENESNSFLRNRPHTLVSTISKLTELSGERIGWLIEKLIDWLVG